MCNLIILALLSIFLFLWLKRRMDFKIPADMNVYIRLKEEYDKLAAENKGLKAANYNLGNALEETVALYNITEQICKTLDGDLVFAYFKDEVNKYIRMGDCKFLKGEIDLPLYKDYMILPIKIEERLIGYLVANGFKEGDKEKFYILTQQFLLGIKRAVLYQEVQELAITDSLTRIFNRRYYLERFAEELERSRKFKYKFSCLMIDIDYFKSYNDRYGHIVGDAVLREISQTIQEKIRQIDLLGRYGGEEFIIILSETDKDLANQAAQRIRQAIEYKPIRAYDEELKITVSIGISTFPEDGQDVETLIDRSDAALYRAKETGRNRVCVY